MAVDLPRAMAPNWTAFHKPTVRHERTDSASDTSTTAHQHHFFSTAKLTVNQPTVMEGKPLVTQEDKEVMLQDRYLSSEEELSPLEPDLSDTSSMLGEDEDDDSSEYSEQEEDEVEEEKSTSEIKEELLEAETFEIMEAVRVTARPVRRVKQSTFSLAVLISIFAPGKPKMVDIVPSKQPETQLPQVRSDRVSSMSVLPENIMRPTTMRPMSVQRPTPIRTSGLPTLRRTAVHIVGASSQGIQERPGSMLFTPTELYSAPPRSSAYSIASSSSSRTPSFSPSDSYSTNSPASSSPATKLVRSSRLRGFSKSLSIARFVNGGKKEKERKATQQSQPQLQFQVQQVPQQLPPPPAPPVEPPRTQSPSSDYSVDSATSTYSTVSPSSPITPDTATIASETKHSIRMVPRGANERAPALELPPYPDNEDADYEASTEDLRAMLRSKPRRLRRMDSLDQIDLATFLARSG